MPDRQVEEWHSGLKLGNTVNFSLFYMPIYDLHFQLIVRDRIHVQVEVLLQDLEI